MSRGSAPFTLHKYPLEISDLIMFKNCNYFYCVSVDPGKVNLGFSVMKISKGKAGERDDSFNKNKGISRKYRLSVCQNDYMGDVNYDTYARYFNKYDFSHVSLVVIEKQIGPNPSISGVAKNIISYFVCKVDAVVIEVSPTLKSNMLGKPKDSNGKKISGKKLKEWEVDTALNFLLKRGDIRGLRMFLAEFPQCEEFIEDPSNMTIRNRILRPKKGEAKYDDKSTTIVQLRALILWLEEEGNRYRMQPKIDLLI